MFFRKTSTPCELKAAIRQEIRAILQDMAQPQTVGLDFSNVCKNNGKHLSDVVHKTILKETMFYFCLQMAYILLHISTTKSVTIHKSDLHSINVKKSITSPAGPRTPFKLEVYNNNTIR